MRYRKAALAFLAWASLALGLSAEAGPGSARLSLVTILPGKALYSSFGHTAIRVVDERGDRLYNFGLSAGDFDLGFALGMLRGKMDFMVGVLRTEPCFAFYRDEENRGIVEQSLALDGDRKASLVAALESAASAENSHYNYRYFTDNCATRPARLLREAVGDESPPFALLPGKTLRSSVYEVLGPRPWPRFAIGLVLGPAADRPIPNGPIFLPGDLMRWAAAASYPTAAGTVPLVGRTEKLYEPPQEAQAGFDFSPTLACLAIAALALLASVPELRLRRAERIGASARRAIGALDAALFILALAPCLAMLLFWLSAGYGEVGWNLNLLWAGPLPLLALALGRGDGPRPAALRLFRLAAALACLAAIGGGLGLQEVSLEARLLAAVVALRCSARACDLAARSA